MLNSFLLQKQQQLKETHTIFLKIKIITNAQKTAFTEVLSDEDQTVKLKVNAIPEKGKANKEIEKFVGKYFDGKCEIVSGHTNNIKLVKIQNN